MSRYVLFLLFWLSCPELIAQEYRIFARRYGIEEGLPHRQVNSIIQDRRGFIWAATNAGVARFDGRRFKVFNQTENGLAGDVVDWVTEDADGYIWACHFGAGAWLNIIDPESGNVLPASRYFRQPPADSILPHWGRAPKQMADGTLVIGAPGKKGQCLFFHPRTGWKRVDLPACISLLVIKITSRQTIWGIHQDAAQRFSLIEINPQGNILQRIWAHPGFGFWEKVGEATTPDGFFVLEANQKEVLNIWEADVRGRLTPVPALTRNPFLPQRARLEGGALDVEFPLILDGNGRILLDISRQFPEIDHEQFRYYLRTPNGDLVFATTFGLVVVVIRKNYFRRLLYHEKAPGGRGLACRGILEINGRLLVNAENFNQHHLPVDTAENPTRRVSCTNGVALSRSADGNVWTHFYQPVEGWQVLSLQKNTPEGQAVGKPLLQHRVHGSVWAILEESPRRVLLGHINGLTVYDPVAGTAQPWFDPEWPDLNTALVNWLGKDRGGHIWACTAQGLFQLKPGGGVIGRYWSGGKGANHLPYNNILHVYEDSAGVFWLGTGGGGLIRWDRQAPANRQVQVFFRKNGLVNGVVYAVYEDEHQHLWLPTDYGIVQFDKKNEQVRRTWLTTDGVTHNEFNRISHCRGADGTLYFGGLNGVTAFRPDAFYGQVDSAGTRFPLVVSDFSILDGSSGLLENRTDVLETSKQISVLPGDRYIQLEFALLDYSTPEQVIYTWKLDGVGSDWETLKEPVLRLSSLPYGNHRLRIRAQAADGSWAKNELNIGLQVLPPVYLRWWFFLLLVIALAAGVRLWLRWRTREHRREQKRLEQEVDRQTNTIRQQTEELQQLDQLKSRFFANVSHELRTPLTLLLGPIEYALNDSGLGHKSKSLLLAARRNSLQLQNLVNEILDLSKLRATGLDQQEQATVLFDFLQEILSSFQPLAEKRAILLQLEYLPDPAWTLALDRQKLLKILGNLLSNALKYAPNGSTVAVQVEAPAGEVLFRVRDAGPGIHPEDLPHIFDLYYQSKRPESKPEGGTGIGLALARELAQAMGGSVWAESAPGAGSVFLLRLPARECPPETAAPLAWGLRHTGVLDAPERLPADPDLGGLTARLLVVEDNPELQAFLRAILPEYYQLTLVDNGRAALEYLSGAETPPDLILSDVMMPEMDGFQLLETLRQSDAWRPIPVVLLTALAGADDRLRAFRIGVDDYITKPFSAEELTVRIENALRNLASRREWMETEPAEPGETADNMDTWLRQLRETARLNLGNPKFNVDDLAERMGVSRKTLYRQIRARTGLSANQLIQELRLLQARELIESGQYRTLRQVADAVGLRTSDYLSRLYRERFGKSPAADL